MFITFPLADNSFGFVPRRNLSLVYKQIFQPTILGLQLYNSVLQSVESSLVLSRGLRQ